METAVISEQGLRWSMEDAHILDTDFGGRGWVFGGVYDGHGGRQAAEFASRNLHHLLLDFLTDSNDPETAFQEAYEEISERLAFQDSGTTAATFLLRDSDLTVANAGDARIILISDTGGVRQLTRDHRIDDEGERERIVRSGGGVSPPYVTRGFRGLMPTRTLGDEYFRPVGIIARPSTARLRLGTVDRFLVAACDGLFDVMTNEEIGEAALGQTDAGTLAETLRREVLNERQGTDNLTIIVLRLTG